MYIFYIGREHAVGKTRNFRVISVYTEILALALAERGTWGKLHVIQELRISFSNGNIKTSIAGVRGPQDANHSGLLGIV